MWARRASSSSFGYCFGSSGRILASNNASVCWLLTAERSTIFSVAPKERGFHAAPSLMSKANKEIYEKKKREAVQKEKKEKDKKKKLKAKKKKPVHKVQAAAVQRPSDPMEPFELEKEEGVEWDSEKTWQKRKALKEGLIPKPLPQEQTISRSELKELLDSQAPGILLIDTRTLAELEVEPPIPGAIHIPARDLKPWLEGTAGTVATARQKRAPPSKATSLIIYGNPEDTLQNTELVLGLSKSGFRVRELINGNREWNKYYNPENKKVATSSE